MLTAAHRSAALRPEASGPTPPRPVRDPTPPRPVRDPTPPRPVRDPTPPRPVRDPTAPRPVRDPAAPRPAGRDAVPLSPATPGPAAPGPMAGGPAAWSDRLKRARRRRPSSAGQAPVLPLAWAAIRWAAQVGSQARREGVPGQPRSAVSVRRALPAFRRPRLPEPAILGTFRPAAGQQPLRLEPETRRVGRSAARRGPAAVSATLAAPAAVP